MALSRVGGSSVAATSVAIPTHVAGDLIVIWAYRDGSTTPPTVPTAGGTVPTFTTIDGPTGANLNSAVCAWAVAAGTTDTSGTWTNATGIAVEVWRGQSSVPIGGHAQSGGSVASGANIAIPAITLTDPSGNSAILAFAGWQTVTAWNAAPSGYTQQSQVATEVEALTKNTTTTDGAFNVTGTASGTGGTRTQQIEIIASFGNRLSQEAIEVVYGTTAAHARLSQLAIEVLEAVPSGGNRLSQLAVEVLVQSLSERDVPFIASVTSVYTPALVAIQAVPFIASSTIVYTPTLSSPSIDVPFIGSTTAVYTPTILHAEVDVPFISSVTVVYTPVVTTLEVDPDFIDSVTVVYTPNLMATFTGGGVSQVALEVAAALTDGDAFVSQVTLEIVVPNYKGLHVWQRS